MFSTTEIAIFNILAQNGGYIDVMGRPTLVAFSKAKGSPEISIYQDQVKLKAMLDNTVIAQNISTKDNELIIKCQKWLNGEY